jgi:hypothetical protein
VIISRSKLSNNYNHVFKNRFGRYIWNSLDAHLSLEWQIKVGHLDYLGLRRTLKGQQWVLEGKDADTHSSIKDYLRSDKQETFSTPACALSSGVR